MEFSLSHIAAMPRSWLTKLTNWCNHDLDFHCNGNRVLCVGGYLSSHHPMVGRDVQNQNLGARSENIHTCYGGLLVQRHITFFEALIVAIWFSGILAEGITSVCCILLALTHDWPWWNLPIGIVGVVLFL